MLTNVTLRMMLKKSIFIVPGGLTSHVQPAEVCWNKPFKAQYNREWIASGEKTYTRGENVRLQVSSSF